MSGALSGEGFDYAMDLTHALPMRMIYIHSELHPLPSVVCEDLGYGNRDRFECHQHILQPKDYRVSREWRERSKDHIVLISKTQRLGMRMVRNIKENQERILTKSQDMDTPIWRKSALPFCFHVDMTSELSVSLEA